MTDCRPRILVVDDEESNLELLRDTLGEAGYCVITAGNGTTACGILAREDIRLALIDLVMPDISGMEVLRRAKALLPDIGIIIMTAYATVETAVEAMKLGALDYLIKPFSMDEAKLHVRRALNEAALAVENRGLRRQLERESMDIGLVGKSGGILEVVKLVDKVADTASTVLILGESGTGKEVVARMIHRGSSRRGPFIALNCGAIPESLLERELFGNEKGAYTGADAARQGLLEAADEGTLFLDEISEMPQELQVKLLRVIEGHEYYRVGGTRPVRSNARFLAATNRDIEKAVREGRFREDLYYRLNVVRVELPALRERGGDIALLAEHFIGSCAKNKVRNIRGLSGEARERLLKYGWPGNVRELRNVIERAIILCEGDKLEVEDLRLEYSPRDPGAVSTEPAAGKRAAAGSPGNAGWVSLPYRKARESFEREYLASILLACGGNVSRAAARVGLNRKSLQEKIKKYGLKSRE